MHLVELDLEVDFEVEMWAFDFENFDFVEKVAFENLDFENSYLENLDFGHFEIVDFENLCLEIVDFEKFALDFRERIHES